MNYKINFYTDSHRKKKYPISEIISCCILIHMQKVWFEYLNKSCGYRKSKIMTLAHFSKIKMQNLGEIRDCL